MANKSKTLYTAKTKHKTTQKNIIFEQDLSTMDTINNIIQAFEPPRTTSPSNPAFSEPWAQQKNHEKDGNEAKNRKKIVRKSGHIHGPDLNLGRAFRVK